VRVVLGLLLLIAAGLKLYGLNVTALPRVGWFATPQVQVLAVEWELVLGLWLLSGAFQFGAWLAAIATFLTFAGVSAYFGWIGVASCGCFGVIRTSPWTAFGVDVAVLLALFISRPRGAFSGARSASKHMTLGGAARSHVSVSILAAAILLALTGIGTFLYGSPAAALARLRGESLSLSADYLDFGTGRPGTMVERTVDIQNWTDQPMRLYGGTSDCSCVTTADLPLTIQPRESVPVTVRMKIPRTNTGVLTRLAEIWADGHKQQTIRLQVGCRVAE